jgi:dynein heavy chain
MYGGRVSDSFDRRVLTTYLEEYLGDFLFDAHCPFSLFSDGRGLDISVPKRGAREVGSGWGRGGRGMGGGGWLGAGDGWLLGGGSVALSLGARCCPALPCPAPPQAPAPARPQVYIRALEALPLAQSPEVFGLHANADISYYSAATKALWADLVDLQPRVGGAGGGTSREEFIGAMCRCGLPGGGHWLTSGTTLRLPWRGGGGCSGKGLCPAPPRCIGRGDQCGAATASCAGQRPRPGGSA